LSGFVNGRINEVTEGFADNCRAAPFTIAAASPNFRPNATIPVDPVPPNNPLPTIIDGQQVTFRTTVTNTGTAASPADSGWFCVFPAPYPTPDDDCYVGPAIRYDGTIPAMGAGETSPPIYSISPWSASAGNWLFTFCADPPPPSGSVDEGGAANETATDNCETSAPFSVTPDNSWLQTEDGNVLSVGNFKLNPAPTGADLIEYVTLTQGNFGSLNTLKDWLLRPYTDVSGPRNFDGLRDQFAVGVGPTATGNIVGALPGNANIGQVVLYRGNFTWSGGYNGGSCPAGSQRGIVMFVDEDPAIADSGNIILGDGGETAVDNNCPLVLIAKRQIRVHGDVRTIQAVLISDDNFVSVDDRFTQPINNRLQIFGSVISSLTSTNPPEFPRNLGVVNNTTPAEHIRLQPQYFWMLRDVLGRSGTAYSEENP
jgi:hypothetical protein